MKRTQWLAVGFLGLIFMGSFVLADQGSWWNRLLPNKEPQVLRDTSSNPPIQPNQEAVSLQDSFAKVAAVVKPAVVNIAAVHITKVQDQQNQFFFGDPNEFFFRYFGEAAPQQQAPPRQKEYRSEGTGSGVIIDPDGYILTNNHVVQGADQLSVTLSDGKVIPGTVVGTDARTDLAVIRIKGTASFSYVPLGDSASMRIGDWVLAVGSPFGLQQTVTAGIVSAIRQSLNIEGKSFSNLIQTDAAINRGNSGGPLVNLKGEVIGINTAIYAPTGVFSGIGFAIPVNDAKVILQDLIKKGFVERSWLGIEITEIDEVIAQQFELKVAEGALINQVIPDSPAEKAGLLRGDVIIEIEGKKVKKVHELQEMISRIHPKTKVTIKVMRNGSSKTVSAVTEVMPSEEAQEKKLQGKEKEETLGKAKLLGADVADITPAMRDRYALPNKEGEGVVILDVPSDSLAAEAGLTEGDVIRSINRMKTTNLVDLKAVKKKLNPKKGLLLDVTRRGRSFYLSYKTLQ